MSDPIASDPTRPVDPMLEESLMDQLVPATILPAVGSHTAELEPVRDVDDVSGDIDRPDEDFLPPPRTRTGRLTIVLAAGLVAGLGVLGGVLIQKHETPSTARGTAGAAAARARFGAGTGTGTGTTAGFGAFGGFGAAAGTGTGTAGAATATTAPPVAVGTVTAISGKTITLKNLGGKTVTIELTATTTVTATGSAALATGATIAVTGTVAADGTVTAATVKQTG